MTVRTKRFFVLWQEVKRRKVLPFLIGYIAACFAIIEFLDITSNRFDIPENTFVLSYILAAIGIPIVIILPWFLNRKKQWIAIDGQSIKEKSNDIGDKAVKHNLPAQLTTFIGRTKEMDIIRQLVSEHRLVTLTGAGGCGKTRLASEVAATMVKDFEDGAWMVDLAPLTSEEFVAKEITETLNISEKPNVPIMDTLINGTKGKNLLIILDNCEHLINTCAEIAGKLIQSSSGLHILATSREALKIKGEKVWRVPSLSLLDPKSIADIEHAKNSDAVVMFIDRAQLNNPEFELVEENMCDVATICNKLDGIPLAIELVASRTKYMNTEMILQRFSDRFEQLTASDPGISTRQRTLQSTIEWSYNLLTEHEKVLFTRLAVFAGGFEILSAEEICADDQLSKEEIFDLLSGLVDRSMVYTLKCRDQSIRYSLLETLKQFGLQLLQTSHMEAFFRDKHLHHYLSLAEESYAQRLESQHHWMKKLSTEHDNMLAAIFWADKHSPEHFVRLTGAISWYWNIINFLIGTDYLESALSKDVKKSVATAAVLQGFGMFQWWTGDLPRGIELLEESLNLFHQFNNLVEEANVSTELSRLYHTAEKHEKGIECSKRSHDLAIKIGNPGLINSCLSFICMSHIFLKQYDKALPIAIEVIAASEKLEQPDILVRTHHFYSDCALGTGDFVEAEKRYALTVEKAIKYNNSGHGAIDLQGVAFALSGQQRWVKAIRVFAAASEYAKSLGLEIGVGFWSEWIDTYIGAAREELGEELTRKYEQEGSAMGYEKAVQYAQNYEQD